MLQAAGIRAGDEVIVPAHSFIATATAVSRIGAKPVFCDIERETFNIDPVSAEAAVGPKTKAIIAVHFGGVIADMDRLENLAMKAGVQLFEDAAHAHGADWKGRRAGGIGRAGTFSFQNSKAMTAGEGGIVITSDAELLERMRSLVNCGRKPGHGWFEHFEGGTNLRLSGFQAAVLLAQLERLPEQIRLRQADAELLQAQHDTPGVHFQQAPEGAVVQTLYLRCRAGWTKTCWGPPATSSSMRSKPRGCRCGHGIRTRSTRTRCTRRRRTARSPARWPSRPARIRSGCRNAR